MIGSSLITANSNGVAPAGTGSILTHGNNQLQANSNDGVFSGNIGLQ
jgi:hypothetical protein